MYIYHTSDECFFARVDKPVRKWIANTIHLQAVDETELRLKSLIFDHFRYMNKLIFWSLCGTY